jgi:hypothetical protein
LAAQRVSSKQHLLDTTRQVPFDVFDELRHLFTANGLSFSEFSKGVPSGFIDKAKHGSIAFLPQNPNNHPIIAQLDFPARRYIKVIRNLLKFNQVQNLMSPTSTPNGLICSVQVSKTGEALIFLALGALSSGPLPGMLFVIS